MSKFACIRMYYLCVINWFAATRWGPEISMSKFACIRMYYLCVIGWFAATRWGVQVCLYSYVLSLCHRLVCSH